MQFEELIKWQDLRYDLLTYGFKVLVRVSFSLLMDINRIISEMEPPSSETISGSVSSELIKPVPKPFSIEALISNTEPKRTNNIYNQWAPATVYSYQHHVSNRDTDSEGSLDLDLAQDLSRHSQKDPGEFQRDPIANKRF